jgi:thiamine-phosphate pyrophosphorylase
MAVPVVHLITDRRVCPDPVARLAASLPAARGRVAVHLREKDLGGAALLALAGSLRQICRTRGALLLVNDRVDVAAAAGADGVHLPSAGIPPGQARRLLPAGALVGVSCHSEADVSRALAAGADYATFGPVFDTPSKRAYGPPLGLEALRRAPALGLPLVALGGIDPGSARAAVAAGARGLAVIRAWLDGPDPSAVVAALSEAFLDPPR